MNKKLLITIFACSAALASCNLDKFPLDKMSPESFFSNEEELQAYSNNFYGFLPSSSLYRGGGTIWTTSLTAQCRD